MYGNPRLSWIPDSTPWIPDSGFQACNSSLLLVELRFWIPIIRENADSLNCIPDSKAHDSGFHSKIFSDSAFHKQNFSESGIRNPDSLSLTWSSSYTTMVFVLYIKFGKRLASFNLCSYSFNVIRTLNSGSIQLLRPILLVKGTKLMLWQISSALLTLCFVHLIFPKISCPGVKIHILFRNSFCLIFSLPSGAKRVQWWEDTSQVNARRFVYFIFDGRHFNKISPRPCSREETKY